MRFNAISKDAKRKCLSSRHGFLFGRPVSQNPRNVDNFGNPTPVGLRLGLDSIFDVRLIAILACQRHDGPGSLPNIHRRL